MLLMMISGPSGMFFTKPAPDISMNITKKYQQEKKMTDMILAAPSRRIKASMIPGTNMYSIPPLNPPPNIYMSGRKRKFIR